MFPLFLVSPAVIIVFMSPLAVPFSIVIMRVFVLGALVIVPHSNIGQTPMGS